MSTSARSIETNSIVSNFNNSVTLLTANQSFTGQGESILDYKSIILNIVSDVNSAAGGISVQFSQDNINWDLSFTDTYNTTSGNFNKVYNVISRYFRIVYTNGTSDQGNFRLQAICHRSMDASLTDINNNNSSSATLITPVPNLKGAFGRLRTANPETLFQMQHTNSKGVYFQDEQLTGGGSATYVADEAAVNLAVSTNGDKVIRQSRRYITYQPGKSLLVAMTGVLNNDNNDSGTTSRIGYFDDDNGVFFEYDGSDVSVVLRSKSSGSVVNTQVSQDDWNIDKMDGTGPSTLTLDVSKAQIFIIDLQWLGVGRVRIGVEIGGNIIYVHQLLHANIATTTYMSRATLPTRYEIESTVADASGSLKEICNTVISEGGFQPVGTPRSINRSNDSQTVAAGTETPLVAIRLKAANKRAGARLKGVGGLVLGSGDTLLQVRQYLAPSVDIFSGGASWTSVDDQSFVEYDISATSIDLSVDNFLVASSYFSNDIESVSKYIDDGIYLSTDISGDNRDIIVVTAINLAGGGNKNILGSVDWTEFE